MLGEWAVFYLLLSNLAELHNVWCYSFVYETCNSIQGQPTKICTECVINVIYSLPQAILVSLIPPANYPSYWVYAVIYVINTGWGYFLQPQ